MILLIDAGNTRIKIGWLNANGQRETSAFAVAHADLAGSLPGWLAQLASPPMAALGVNVAGTGIGLALETILRQQCACNIRWITSQKSAAGLRNTYDVAEQLGADRWVSMIGLAQHTDQAAILASFGTATTIDTLGPVKTDGTASRLFHGGLIFPGPALMRSSLVSGTANLPEAMGQVVAYPHNTHQAIASGIAAAQAGALIRQWHAGQDQFGQAPLIFSSGGAWHTIEDEAQRLLARAQHDLNLPSLPIQWLASPVLDGLARLAQDDNVFVGRMTLR
ncbi:type III pantothenate kinase [Alcaligenaceae bacterium]|nr:type III pantothenate kinase [Alcaligenaceae bacterium]